MSAQPWPVSDLKSVTLLITKGTTPKNFAPPAPGAINYIKSESLSYDGLVDADAFVAISPETHHELARSKLQEHDILYSIAGAKLGKCGSVRKEHLPANTNQAVAIVRVDPKKADWRFVEFLLRNPSTVALVNSGVAQSAQPNFNLTDLGAQRFGFPPLAEQRAIAGVLGALDDKIEANRRMNATLEALARALFKSWFVDFDPVRAKIEGREPALAPDLAALFPARLTESQLGPIPEGWEVSRFDSVAANVSDVAKAEELEGDEHYIGLEHMPRKSISLAEWDDASGLESHKARFCVGDTLFGKLRPYFHKVGRALTDGVCSTDIVVVRAKRPLHAAYSLMHASSVEFVAFNDQSSTGTKMPRTNWGRMAEYPLVAPSDPVSEAFEETVSPMLNRIGANVFQSRTLAQLRDLLLPKLLSGALRVRDAERMIGDVA